MVKVWSRRWLNAEAASAMSAAPDENGWRTVLAGPRPKMLTVGGALVPLIIS